MKDLQAVLRKGNGIALVCVLVECPSCSKDIWVEIGQHCGSDASLDNHAKTDCYECCKPIEIFGDTNQKDYSFMTISDYVKLTSDNFIKNYKKDE